MTVDQIQKLIDEKYVEISDLHEQLCDAKSRQMLTCMQNGNYSGQACGKKSKVASVTVVRCVAYETEGHDGGWETYDRVFRCPKCGYINRFNFPENRPQQEQNISSYDTSLFADEEVLADDFPQTRMW